MGSVGIAIIGGGIFVRTEHLPAVLAAPSASLKAIWSRSLKSAEETAALIPKEAGLTADLYSTESGAGKSLDDLLARADIKGVILALPIVDQPAFIEKALAAGKHVLAEKPVAKDVASARALIESYHRIAAETKATLAIAENYRFNPGWTYAAEEVKKLGRVTSFVVRVQSFMAKENKYYNTSWRTKPQYQGGFLLDGGVHHAAALRKVLGSENAIESLTAQTSLVSEHLPPIDTFNAVLKTKTGAFGSYICSSGSTLRAFEFHFGCEQGQVQAENAKVVTIRGTGPDAPREEKVYEKSSGVKEEVHAWVESIVSGKPHPEQSPELALGDLELQEKIFTSGDQDGARQTLEFQTLA